MNNNARNKAEAEHINMCTSSRTFAPFCFNFAAHVWWTSLRGGGGGGGGGMGRVWERNRFDILNRVVNSHYRVRTLCIIGPKLPIR